MAVDWRWSICREQSRTHPAPASWGRGTSVPRTPCESGRRSTWVRREEGSWWIVEPNVRVSLIHLSLMVSSILRASFRYCFSACVTNSNITDPPLPLHHSHLSHPHPSPLLSKLTSSDAPCLSRSSTTSKLASMFWFSMSCTDRHFSSPSYTGTYTWQ